MKLLGLETGDDPDQDQGSDYDYKDKSPDKGRGFKVATDQQIKALRALLRTKDFKSEAEAALYSEVVEFGKLKDSDYKKSPKKASEYIYRLKQLNDKPKSDLASLKSFAESRDWTGTGEGRKSFEDWLKNGNHTSAEIKDWEGGP